MSAKQQLQREWERTIKSDLPPWIDAIKPCVIKPTTIGVQLSFYCKCQDTVVQVPWRCAQGTHEKKIAAALFAKLTQKHTCCYPSGETLTAVPPEDLQQRLFAVQTQLKRKSEEVSELRGQLSAKKGALLAEVKPDLKELTRKRSKISKDCNSRAVPIDSNNREKFAHRSDKQNGLNHAETGVNAALRYHCKGSTEKAIVLLKASIKQLGLRYVLCVQPICGECCV